MIDYSFPNITVSITRPVQYLLLLTIKKILSVFTFPQKITYLEIIPLQFFEISYTLKLVIVIILIEGGLLWQP